MIPVPCTGNMPPGMLLISPKSVGDNTSNMYNGVDQSVGRSVGRSRVPRILRQGGWMVLLILGAIYRASF